MPVRICPLYPVIVIVVARLSAAAGSADPAHRAMVVPLTVSHTALQDPLIPNSSMPATVYMGTVAIGTPRQEFTVLFDTGSSSLWLPGVHCTSDACDRHRRYNWTASSTAHETDPPILASSTFATGDLSGHALRDEVCLATAAHERAANGSGIDGTGEACATIHILAADSESQFPFVGLPFDGILGLGPPRPEGEAVDPQEPLPGPVAEWFAQLGIEGFALRLNRTVGSNNEVDGEVSFAPVSLLVTTVQSLAGPVLWAPIVEAQGSGSFWAVRVRSIHVGEQQIFQCNESNGDLDGCRAMLDSGSTFMMGPWERILIMQHKLGFPLRDQDCNREFPDLQFKIEGVAGDTTLTLSPEDYLTSNDGVCAAAFNPIDLPPTSAEIWVFGQPLLRRYIAIHDIAGRRVGLADSSSAAMLPAGVHISPAVLSASALASKDANVAMNKTSHGKSSSLQRGQRKHGATSPHHGRVFLAAEEASPYENVIV